MKRLAAVVLIMMLAFSGCTEKEQKTEAVTEGGAAVTEAVTEEMTEAAEIASETEEESTESTEAASEDITEEDSEDEKDPTVTELSSIENLDDQLKLIAEKADEWKIDELDQWVYAITDLDENGRLEVVSASVGGTGNYTNAYYYEVDESFTKLEPVKTEYEQGDSEPDVTVELADVYSNPETGEKFYIFSDMLKISAGEMYDFVYSISLKDGNLAAEVIGSSYMSTDGEDEVETLYYDAEENEITEDEYIDICTKKFEGFDQGILTVGWTMVDQQDPEYAFPEETEKLEAALRFSALGYSVSIE